MKDLAIDQLSDMFRNISEKKEISFDHYVSPYEVAQFMTSKGFPDNS